MLRATLALLLGPLLAACGNDKTLIEVDPPRYDFGRVMQGRMPEHVFKLTNHSDRTVGFKVQANCACFAVAHTLAPLDPGRSLEFRVLFDTTALPPQKAKGKYLTIHTDHPEVGMIAVPLDGEIFRAYELTPAQINLGRIDGRPTNYAARVVRLRPVNEYQVRLKRAVQMPQVFDIETAEKPNGGLDVSLTLRRDVRRPVGRFHAQVRLELELTAPGGAKMTEKPVVTLVGLWTLK